MAAIKIGILLTVLFYFTCVDSWYMGKPTKYIAPKVITDACKKTNSKTLADTKYCHKYYECSEETKHKTCRYPKLFSQQSNSCEDFKKVKCGSRKEITDYCGYFVIYCTRCTPCHVNSPSCAGYPDGKNIHSYKGAPFYMVCDTGRLMTTGLCNGKYIIDYSCYDKPCSNKLNARYGTGHCDSYIWCYYGREFTYQCPAGTVFDKRRGSCQHKYDTCKPCGTKSC